MPKEQLKIITDGTGQHLALPRHLLESINKDQLWEIITSYLEEIPAEEPMPVFSLPEYMAPDHAFRRHGYIYVLRASNGLYKIGRAVDLHKRMQQYTSLKSSFGVELIHSFLSHDCLAEERRLHKRFLNKRLENSEWFALGPIDVDYLKSL